MTLLRFHYTQPLVIGAETIKAKINSAEADNTTLLTIAT